MKDVQRVLITLLPIVQRLPNGYEEGEPDTIYSINTINAKETLVKALSC